MRSSLLILFILSNIISCAQLTHSQNDSHVSKHVSKKYILKDKSGEFILNREKGVNKKKNLFIVKSMVLPSNGDTSKALEKVVTISNPGILGKKVPILRPNQSEYNVWFEGKKYSSRMTVNLEDKTMDIKLRSPEVQWSGDRKVSFPDGNGIYCFYAQVVECARFTGFISKAIKSGAGKMRFTLIWEGYPYIQEQYLNLPSGVFSDAILEYDGTNKMGEKRFTLSTGNQSIFYLLDSASELKKIFWISQGLTIVEREL